MNCNDLEKHLADYLGDELEPALRAAIDAHVAECDPCRGRVEALAGTVGTLRGLDTVSESQAEQRVEQLQLRRRRPLPQRVAFATLRAAALIALGVTIGLYASQDRQEPEQVTVVTDPVPENAASTPRDVHPGWLQVGRRAGGTSSSFGRSLMALAQVRGKK